MHVLVVDDFAPFRRFICATLTEQSELRIVAEAANGLEAVQKAEELQPGLVLLDVGLPKLNGIAAAERIRRVAATARIVFLLPCSDVDVIHAALSDRATGYVLKADVGRKLLPVVQAVLRGEGIQQAA